MSDSPTPNVMPGAQPETPSASPVDVPTPPWGADNSKYDPDQAARLIANLRASEDSQAKELKAQNAKLAELESALAEAKPLLEAHTEQQRREQGEAETLRQDMAALQDQLTAAQQSAQTTLHAALQAKAEALACNRDPNRPGSAFINPATAAKLIDLTDCSADGQIDETAIASKLDALAQSDPYLIAPATPTGRKPNPAQGQGGGSIPLDAQIEAAEKSGDIMRSIALKQQKLYQR